jgi:hypothetical protein
MIKGANFHIFQSRNVLGTKEEFCQALYHIRETPECNQPVECLNQGLCSPKVCIALAFIDNYTARYSNCADKVHAEDFLVKDRKLLAVIRQSRDTTLKCYLTLQPCHYSSNAKQKSCTLLLLKFLKEELTPRNIKLDLVITYPYRTHWESLNEEELARYSNAIENARKGTKLLSQTINVRACTTADWEFLMKECETEFSISASRQKMDLFTQSIIEKYS